MKAAGGISPFAFDREALADLAGAHAASFQNARPFPHVVLDDFLPRWAFDTLVAEFPGADDIPWDQYSDEGNTRKLATQDELRLGPFTRQLVGHLNGSVFVSFLEDLTGIKGLVPDPHLVGGGLHLSERGGYLRIHADFNLHPRLRLDRRLNLLLYLNPHWEDDWGGQLELWDEAMTRCEAKISPVGNRCMIFSTTDKSFHGHPEPLACPDDQVRRSLSLFYYTNGRPEDERSAPHSTLYQAGRGSPDPSRRSPVRRALRRVLPRPVADAARRLEARTRRRRM